MVEVFKIYALNRFQQLHPLTLLVLRIRLSRGFSALFPVGKECGGRPAGGCGHVSSWTPAACEDLEAADEPAAQLEEDVELLIEEEEDPAGCAERFGSYLLLVLELAAALVAPPSWGLREGKEGGEKEEEEEEASQLLLVLHRVPLRLQAPSYAVSGYPRS